MPSLTKRVLVRDRVWRVQAEEAKDGRKLLTLLDPDGGDTLRVLAPPEQVEILPQEAPIFSRDALSPWAPWQTSHDILRQATIGPSDEFAALFNGRISPEPYQFEPVRRLLQLPRPALLIADDVGLGKTIEAGICLVEFMARGLARENRFLLIVPPGLIPQWQDEMQQKFGLEFISLENAASVDRAQTNLPEGIKPWRFHNRIITSVEFMKKKEILRNALRHRWDAIVVDEAHYLAESGTPRNPYTTARARLGQQLREATHALILLTATPHNGYSHSFRSLLEIVEPTDATFEGDEETIRRRISRCMIRRLKPQIFKTDEKGVKVPAFVPRAPVKQVPVDNLSDKEEEIFRKVSSYCARTAKAAADTEEKDLVGFAMQIIKKRMLSSRSALAITVEHRIQSLKGRQTQDEPPTRSEVMELQGDLPLSEAAQERIAGRIVGSAVPKEAKRRKAELNKLKHIQKLMEKVKDLPDPKIQALVADLKESVFSQDNEKAIVFTEYRDTLSAVCDALDNDPDCRGSYVQLTGGLSTKQRLQRMAAFEKPETRLMMATDAASEGLNLQLHCRRIYHLELPWNPNRLEQRNGRVDRHGQKREPIIRYLFYPHSPEDHILDRLIRRIFEMQKENVSTPDILGILSAARIEEALTGIDAEEQDADACDTLFRIIEEQRGRFDRDVRPILALAESMEGAEYVPSGFSADPMVEDDSEFESSVLRRLGSAATEGPIEHTYNLRTPFDLKGPGVADMYPCFTLRRSVAVDYPAADVEYITRLHPLFKAMTHHALKQLSGSHSPNVPVRRLAVRRHQAAANSAFAVFTFGTVHPGRSGGLLQVAVDLSGNPLQGDVPNVLDRESPPGEVDWGELNRVFGKQYASMQGAAARRAGDLLAEEVKTLRARREDLAETLRQDAEKYREDRLNEIDREETNARKADVNDKQERFSFDSRAVSGFKAKKAAVETHHKKRLEEIDSFVSIPDPDDPQPLGALFVFPPEDRHGA